MNQKHQTVKEERGEAEAVSTVAHQFKTPLTAIKWLAELLIQDDDRLTADQRGHLRQIYDTNNRLIMLVSDLLDASRSSTGRKFGSAKKTADLIAVLRQTAKEQEVVAGKNGVKIAFGAKTPESVIVPMVASEIAQAVGNLVDNAVKFSPPCGSVRIQVSDGEKEATVSVSDDGIGIPEAEKDRVFSRLYRGGNVGDREGIGLGVYIAKAIVEGHGGRIWFESEENVGTTFNFSLPK